MNITDTAAFVIETDRKPLVFARVETDDGTYGVGEADATSAADTVARRIVDIGKALVGTDPHDRESLAGGAYNVSVLVDSAVNPGPNAIVDTAAVSAIDIALWDIVAKRSDRPLYDLLGGPYHGREVPVYANGWWQDCYRRAETAPEDFAERAAGVVSDGYDALKFNPFDYDSGYKSRGVVEVALERVEAVREAVGPRVDLLIEGHKQFTAAQAIDVARRLEPTNPTFFEEPTPPNVRSLERVSAATSIPIATGESFVTHHAFGELLPANVGVVQPDPLRTGGVTTTKKIAGLADSVGVQFAPHNACGTVGTLVSAHLATSCPSFTLLEVFEDYSYPDWVHDVYHTGMSISDGRLILPDEAGLAIDLDFETLTRRGERY